MKTETSLWYSDILNKQTNKHPMYRSRTEVRKAVVPSGRALAACHLCCFLCEKIQPWL